MSKHGNPVFPHFGARTWPVLAPPPPCMSSALVTATVGVVSHYVFLHSANATLRVGVQIEPFDRTPPQHESTRGP